MNKTRLGIIALLISTVAHAADNMGIPEKYGTFSGRVQSLSMFRDFENKGDHNYSHSLGLQLDYLSPEVAGLTVGASYTGVGVVDAGDIDNAYPGQARVLNGRMNVLNEGYLQYSFADLNASNTTITVGRQAQNSEIYRHTEARQKKRSQEGIFFQSKDVDGFTFIAGHSWKLSNIYGIETNNGLSWEFDNYSEVFGYGGAATSKDKTKGISHFETAYKGCKNLEISFFDAYAWDVANVIGTRAKFYFTEATAIEGQYRWENEVGEGTDHNSDCFSLALIQKIGALTLEGGYFGVHGDKLRFEENTTGINHALNYSLILDTAHFNGGADTAYMKAVKKINKTTLYGLFAATWHKKAGDVNHIQELDLIVKQQLTDNLSVALKGGVGQRQVSNTSDQTQLDGRVFLTYSF